MDPGEIAMHHAAARFYGRESSCERGGRPKLKYGSEKAAVRAAVTMSRDYKTLEAYPCPFCKDWHVGRALTARERSYFSRQVRKEQGGHIIPGEETVYADACLPGGEPEPISDTEFQLAMAEAERERVTQWWVDHVNRHKCPDGNCALRDIISRAAYQIDDIRFSLEGKRELCASRSQPPQPQRMLHSSS